MVAVEHGDGPTLDDERGGRLTLWWLRVWGEMRLHGSVARGEKHCGSDIDLGAVFDDVDYRQRLSVTHDLWKRFGRRAGTGWR